MTTTRAPPTTVRPHVAHFDAEGLARLETRMWQAYYRRQPARLTLP